MARILIIDDDADYRLLLRDMLEAAGHSVAEAINGASGLKALEGASLAITDILMPDSDGIEFLREASRRYPELPVIAISGGGRTLPADVTLTMSRAFGAHKILYKPFTRAELLNCVSSLLARPRRGQGG